MLTIMLVDDNLTFLAAVRKFLTVLPDAQVIAEAHDGHQALAQAAQCHPDLLLLDIAMPGLDGLAVARRLQAWPKAPQIIFLSMNDNESYRTEAQELGVFGFVDKADLVERLPPLIARLVTTGSAHRTGEGA